MKILSFGEVLFDLIEGEPHLGGAPLNFAAHLAKLGAESYMLSKVGAGELGRQAMDKIEKLGLRMDFMGIDPAHPTGTVDVTLNEGKPDYHIHEEVAFDYIELENWEQLKSQGFDVLYFGSLAQRGTVSAISLDRILRDQKFTHIFYDVNLRKDGYSKNIIKRSLNYCTIFKLSDEEMHELSKMFYGDQLEMEEFMRMITNDFDVKTVIVTAGAEGSFILHDSVLSFIKAYRIELEDSIGAGDSFSAAFLHTFLLTDDPIRSLDNANYLGAYVSSHRGAIPDYNHEVMERFGLNLKG